MGKFVTAINCMDGRVQEPIINWMKEKYAADYVDMITEAGPNKILLYGPEETIEAIKEKVKISYERHGSEVLAVAGHYDCAGYPVSREKKISKIIHSVELINSWDIPMKVIGLYVNENWEVEEVVSA
ncbi:carbonic anhydrase [Bacillaceae bacterium W0354]